MKLLTKNSTFYLIGIFLLAFLLRIYKLHILPFTFHEDEVLSGYVGRFILQNGTDVYGNRWPLLYFNKFGDYYIILPMYLAGLSTYIFGINEFAVRFPAALFGSLAVFPVYILTWQIFRNKKIALIGAFLLAITPWHIVLSRTSSEGIIGSTIFLTGVVFLLQSIRKKGLLQLFLSAILFLMSYMIYHPFRVYVPPLVLASLIIFYKTITQHKKLLSGFILMTIFFFGLTFYIGTTPWGKGRFIQTSIFSQLSGVQREIDEQILNTGPKDVFLTRLFHNKLTGYSREFLVQYFSYFSPVFLFFEGNQSFESRLRVPDQGLFFISFLILLIGLFINIAKEKRVDFDKNIMIYFITLFFIAPVPAAFTYYGSPNVHRSVLMSLLFPILFAYGFYKLANIKFFFKHFIAICLIVIIAIELTYFWQQYSIQADYYTAQARNDAQRELIQYLQSNRHKFDRIYVPVEGTIALYYLFFTKDFSSKYTGKFGSDVRIDKLENIVFIDNSCPSSIVRHSVSRKDLVIDRHSCIFTEGFREIGTVKGKNPLLIYKLYMLKEK